MDPKLPPAIAALLGVAQACIGPCLTDSWSGSEPTTDRAEGTGDSGDSGLGPCLAPVVTSGDTGATGSVTDTGSDGTGDTGVTAAATGEVKEQVLGSGRLPDDVVERLRGSR